jgi:hypothetical protein
MTRVAALSGQEIARVRAAAQVLLPGTPDSPAPDALREYDDLLQQAAAALAGDREALATAIGALPPEPSWESLSAFAELEPTSFELVCLLAVGAYFMSPAVLTSLGTPTGPRRPADREQVVDELGTGILDAVLERGCPVRTLEDVNERSAR